MCHNTILYFVFGLEIKELLFTCCEKRYGLWVRALVCLNALSKRRSCWINKEVGRTVIAGHVRRFSMSRDRSRLKGVPSGAGPRVAYALQISLLSVVHMSNVPGSTGHYTCPLYPCCNKVTMQNAVKFNLSLSSTNVLRRASHVSNLWTRRKRKICFAPKRLCHPRTAPRYPSHRRLCVPLSKTECIANGVLTPNVEWKNPYVFPYRSYSRERIVQDINTCNWHVV